MRWGAASAQPGSLRWVRPLQSIVATFGPETESPEVVPFEIGGIRAGTTTYGHRFLAPGPIEVRRFDDYIQALEKAKVILDADRRKDVILHDARDLAFARGLDLVEDDGLLEEVAGLVEWPVVLLGSFDEAFLDIPAEAIRATIRANQKCFVLRKSGYEDLAPPSSWSRTWSPATAASPSRQATNGWCGHGSPTPSSSGRRTRRSSLRIACRSSIHRLPREARDAGTAHRAHRGAGQGTGPLVGADPTWQSKRRASPRPISSPRWSASSPNCRA